MICRIRIQTQKVASDDNCTASDAQCGKSLTGGFQIKTIEKNNTRRKVIVLISGRTLQIQWTVRIGYNEMSVPLAGIEPLFSQMP